MCKLNSKKIVAYSLVTNIRVVQYRELGAQHLTNNFYYYLFRQHVFCVMFYSFDLLFKTWQQLTT